MTDYVPSMRPRVYSVSNLSLNFDHRGSKVEVNIESVIHGSLTRRI